MRNDIICIMAAALLLASCASQKVATGDGAAAMEKSALSPEEQFVAGIIGNDANTENIVGSASVTLRLGDKDITVPGALRMRRDKVIRLQLFIPIIGTEIGRLEFTPDYVLVMDRINKQYVKGDYNQLDFLRNNGLSFYSLQSLFWNQLVVPDQNEARESDAGKFSVDLTASGSHVPITLDKGNMKYQWQASRKDNTLTSAVITYNSSSSGASMLSWLYSNFVAVGKSKFPKNQEFTFQTTAGGKSQQGEIKIKLDEVKTSSDWEAETSVSSKYRKVEAEDVLSKLMSF